MHLFKLVIVVKILSKAHTHEASILEITTSVIMNVDCAAGKSSFFFFLKPCQFLLVVPPFFQARNCPSLTAFNGLFYFDSVFKMNSNITNIIAFYVISEI